MKFIDFQQWSNLRNGKKFQLVVSMISWFYPLEIISPKHNSFIQYMYYFLTILSYGSKKTKQHTNILTLKWLAILKELELHHQIL
jgi:hypothetical protein